MTAGVFQTALADRWALLPRPVQDFHTVTGTARFSGRADIVRGPSLMAGIANALFRFPLAGTNVPVTLTITRTGQGERWLRDFGGRVMQTSCRPARTPYRYYERVGPFTYEMDLPVRDGAMYVPVRRGWLLGLPLPRWFLPGSDSREFAADGRFHFDIALTAPLTGGLIVRYRGWLVRECDP